MTPSSVDKLNAFISQLAMEVREARPALRGFGRPQWGAASQMTSRSPILVHFGGVAEDWIRTLSPFEKHDQLQWLDGIDVMTMSPSSNPLMAILVRIEAVCGELGDPAGIGAPFRHGLLSDDANSPLSLLSSLMSAAAAGFPGNVNERAADMDPEVYAVELIHAERSRIAFDQRFRGTVDVVSNALTEARRAPEPVLFALSMINMDYDPERTEEILNLLQYLGSPRIMVFLLGSVGVHPRALYALDLDCGKDR